MTGKRFARQGTFLGLSRGGWAWVLIVLTCLAIVSGVLASTAINGSKTDARLCDATQAFIVQFTSDKALAVAGSADTNLPATSRARSKLKAQTLTHTITTLRALKQAAC